MGKLLEQLKSYFENTPANILEKESAKWDYLNEIGPDVLEYANIVKGYIRESLEIPKTTELEYANIVKGYISAKIAYRSSDNLINKSYYNFIISIDEIGANAQYGKAA